MLKYETEKAYNNAKKRWPAIAWPKEMFYKHVQFACSQADGRKATFLEDLYLGGSAGHRLDQAWIVIHNDIAPEVINIMSRRASGNLTTEELWSRTLERLIDEDRDLAPLYNGCYPAKIIRYRGLVKLINYCVTVANRLAIQNHRKRDADLSISAVEGGEQNLVSRSGKPEQHLMASEDSQVIIDTIVEAYKALSSEQRFLITMVYRQGMKQKQAAKILKWSEAKTTRQLAKAIEIMRKAIEEKGCIEFTEKVSDAFSSLWRESLNN